MITCRGLGFGYERGTRTLAEVDFHLPEGRLLGLVGANGSGKSTLLAILAGLFVPREGEARVAGHVTPGEEAALRQSAGLVVQNADLQILGSTVEEDLLLGVESRPGGRVEAARELARRFDLEESWERPVQTLSGGQKRKLAICGILLREPRVLLLDEPLSGLDYPAALELRAILAEQRRAGLTQVVAAHDVEPLADLADLWAVLERGRLRAFGPAAEVFGRLREFGVRPPCSWQAGRGVQPWDEGVQPWDGGEG